MGFKDEGFEGLGYNAVTAKLEDVVQWARARSTWGVTFGLACCAIEMMGAGGAHYDLARFGMEVWRASPRQSDIMVVAGRVSQKMAPVLRQVYDQMPDPKWVISMGVCASTGGMFNNYAIVQGVDQVVPVDIYAPGCPPTPETLIHAITHLRYSIETGDILRRHAETGAGAGIHLDEPTPEQRVVVGAPGTEMSDEVAAEAAEELPPAPTVHGCPIGESRGQQVVHVPVDRYLEVMSALLDEGYEFCSDLTAVDYLGHPGRPLPEGVVPERFEVVVSLLDMTTARRTRVRVQVPDTEPAVPTLFPLWPGTEAMEREVFDMFGVRFDGHPDMTRILMPEDWDGHPLRKDYDVGRIPVQFKATR